jgi:hypothetical protein
MYLGVHKATVEKGGLAVGDSVEVTIELDTEPREIDIPGELERALEANAKAKTAWDALSPSHKRPEGEGATAAREAPCIRDLSPTGSRRVAAGRLGPHLGNGQDALVVPISAPGPRSEAVAVPIPDSGSWQERRRGGLPPAPRIAVGNRFPPSGDYRRDIRFPVQSFPDEDTDPVDARGGGR